VFTSAQSEEDKALHSGICSHTFSTLPIPEWHGSKVNKKNTTEVGNLFVLMGRHWG
jgi:hypothetical protein